MQVTYLIHPLNHLIIRHNTLVGFENEICLDKLDKESLKFKTTKYSTTSTDSLFDVRDETVGMRGVPRGGWVMIETEASTKITDVWSEAMKKLLNEETV